jgi:hypothetical protein
MEEQGGDDVNIITGMIRKLSKYLFWDVSIKTVSETDHADFIIQRVTMLGTWKDWKIILKHYGLKKIKTTLLSARYLDDKTLSFSSVIFNLPKERFRCYSTKQSTRKLWSY